jgi:hypothetical protein
MSLTREQLLGHVHPPLQSAARRSSPTKSTYRARWREISEWTDFAAEAQEYWDGLGETEKTQVIPEARATLWDQLSESLAVAMPVVSREGHLLIPFMFKYSIPHNHAIPGAHDLHAQITTNIPDSIIGQPDACFEHDDKIGGVIEVKTFWNLTQQSVLEVIQGSSL